MKNFKVTGESREVGAIGIFEPFITNVVAGCSFWAYEDVKRKLYSENRDHVHIKEIREVTDNGSHIIEPRAYLNY